MTVNPVDMQVILPQTGQVNKLSRGLQFQQQTEQQILGQQVQAEMRRQEHQVKKTTHVEHNRVENEKQEKKRDRQNPSSGDKGKKMHAAGESTGEAEEGGKKKPGNLGSVLDIKI